jgi:hypothetical protein
MKQPTVETIMGEMDEERLWKELDEASRPEIKFEPNPHLYVRPVKFHVGGQRILVFESSHSHMLSSSVSWYDIILVAVAPDLYYVPEGRSQPLTKLMAEFYAMGFSYSRAEPLYGGTAHATTDEPWFYDPVYHIPPESFLRLPYA